MSELTEEGGELFHEANEALEEAIEEAEERFGASYFSHGYTPMGTSPVATARKSVETLRHLKGEFPPHPNCRMDPVLFPQIPSEKQMLAYPEAGRQEKMDKKPAADPDEPRMFRTKAASMMVGSEGAESRSETKLLPPDGYVRGDKKLPGEPAEPLVCESCGEGIDYRRDDPIEEDGEWFCDELCYNDDWE